MMLRQGFPPSSHEWTDVAFALNRELKLKPWDEIVLDLEAYDIPPAELENDSWRHARELHRQLAAAA